MVFVCVINKNKTIYEKTPLSLCDYRWLAGVCVM